MENSNEKFDVLAYMRSLTPTEKRDNNSITLKEWNERWITIYCKRIKQTTKEAYICYVNKHINRVLGDLYINEITREDIQLFVNSMSLGIGLKKPLSSKSIKNVHGILHKSLDVAVENQYVYHYCANEYLKRYGELQYSAQEEYDKARKIINSYSRIITEYCNIKEKIKNTINPIKKISLRKELAEQGDKACDAARGLSSYFNSSLYYNNCELDYNNITYDHLSAIKSYTDHAIFQKKAAAEKEKSYNEIREQLKSRNISDKSVDLAYRKLVTVVAAVPDEQCELALKVVKEPTKYFSFEEYGHNSEHRLAALKNVEKAISRLYEAVKRIKPEIKTEQKQEKKKHRSYGGRSR